MVVGVDSSGGGLEVGSVSELGMTAVRDLVQEETGPEVDVSSAVETPVTDAIISFV